MWLLTSYLFSVCLFTPVITISFLVFYIMKHDASQEEKELAFNK